MTSASVVLKPKERQFQVVPVPAIFTRGRWECVDYKDGTSSTTASTGAINTNGTNGNGNGGQGQQQQTAASVPPSATPQFFLGPAELPPLQPQQQQPPTPATITTTEFDKSMTMNGGQMTPASSFATTSAACMAANTSNAVAIDNKIEQAMDLVKTHLTFAVREEVEILRSTITELESRVNMLENENQILRQFAPADVTANLSTLVQQQQQTQTTTNDPASGDGNGTQHAHGNGGGSGNGSDERGGAAAKGRSPPPQR